MIRIIFYLYKDLYLSSIEYSSTPYNNTNQGDGKR